MGSPPVVFAVATAESPGVTPIVLSSASLESASITKPAERTQECSHGMCEGETAETARKRVAVRLSLTVTGADSAATDASGGGRDTFARAL